MKKQSIAVLVILLFFVLGVLGDRLILGTKGESGGEALNQLQMEKFQKLQEKFSSINDQDLLEYQRLKALEQKYKKADEILGKIILIMLADMGLKVSPENVRSARLSVSHGADEELKTTPRPNPLPVPVSAGVTSPPGGPSGWRNAESRLGSASLSKDVDSLLSDLKIPDFVSELNASAIITELKGPINSLIGTFAGDVIFKDGSSRNYQLLIELNAQVDDRQQLRGKQLIQLSENGKPLSTTNGDGDLRHFRQFINNPNAILVETGSHYFQLYYIKEDDAFIGNYYYKNVNAYAFTGTVKLTRQ